MPRKAIIYFIFHNGEHETALQQNCSLMPRKAIIYYFPVSYGGVSGKSVVKVQLIVRIRTNQRQ